MNMKKQSWEDFRLAGLLWYVNRILHVFGWTIVLEVNDDDTIADAWPSRTRWKGFSPELDAVNFDRMRQTMRDVGTESIARAAIRVDGQVWSVPRPGRHHDVVRQYCKDTGVERMPLQSEEKSVQGFLTSRGRFVDRHEAAALALEAGQIDTHTPKLFSEDVWGSPYYQRFYRWAQKEIEAIEADERFGYPPANVQTNAVLALIQVELKARHQALLQMLTLPVEETSD